MISKTFEDMRDLSRFFLQGLLQAAITNAKALCATLRYGTKYGFVFFVEQVETTKAATLFFDRSTDFVHLFDTVGWVVNWKQLGSE